MASTTTFHDVFNGVENALRRQFGASAEVDMIQEDERVAFFAFSVDDVDYSLSVNVTE